MTQKIIILGATSAIAGAFARDYAGEGAAFALAGRDAERLRQVAADLEARGAAKAAVVACDLSDASGAKAALAAMAATIGGADIVLVAYGALGEQADAEQAIDAARALLDVNFTSAALWSLAAASLLEEQGGGALVALSSVAGDRGRQSNFIYGAAKGGLSIFYQGLAHRMARRGVHVVAVKAGFVDTPMTAAFKKGPLWASPQAVARAARDAIEKKRGPFVYAPSFWRYVMLAIRATPAPVFHRTKL
ncbi:MAG: SDR family NAD(P)-dependent oxidoreductase [Parvularculaceae bacterium]|nr:SDR family NAD(P)-dependent oxidoreductase [Parvularculaceae bacterium]